MYSSKKYFLFIFFSLVISFVFSQVQLSPVVIGSAGSHATAGNMQISYTVGEVAVTTISNSVFTLTQGFHQPIVAAVPTTVTLQIRDTVKNASCLSAKDGEISVTVLNGTPPYTYSWSPVNGSESTITGLAPGVYYLLVVDAMNNEGRDTIIVGSVVDDMCDIHVYSGITPNADGINDEWIIDGILLFPDNEVNIYNRWGEKVWHVKGYDNKEKFWKGNDLNGDKLPDGTYYYILEIPGMDTLRGWVQITR